MTKYIPLPEKTMNLEEVGVLARALSDESRLRVLLALRHEAELCVCQLTELLDLAPSTVSRHLAVLRQAGLIVAQKHGRWVYVRRGSLDRTGPRARLMKWLDDSLGDVEPSVAADCCRLDEILQCDPSELSARQT